jgi:hypothetical protein
MTEQPTSGSASAQLKQMVTDRLNLGLGLAAKAAGQQAGTMAQAVRQTGEEMRQQGQEGQGKIADRIAQPIQRVSANLSQADPKVSSDVKALKPKLTQQVQQVKTQAASQLKDQTQTRTTAAAQGAGALTQGVRQVGQQLRAQGQQTPALVMDALAEKMEPVAGYLNTTDPDKLRSDVAAYRQKAQLKVSNAVDTVNRKQQAATAKGTQAVKSAASRVRSQPALPIAAGAVSLALVARRMRKNKAAKQQGPESPELHVDLQGLPASQFDTTEIVPGQPAEDLQFLTRAQLRDRATSAGLEVSPDMSKNELINALQSR